MVLWPGLRKPRQPHLLGPALLRALWQSVVLPKGLDALHALLPLVPAQGAPELENPRSKERVPKMPMGSLARLLAMLPVVRQLDPKIMNSTGC